MDLREAYADQPTEELTTVSPLDPDMVFYAVKDGGVTEVDIYLDQRLLDQLNRIEPVAWQGLLEFIEDDIEQRDDQS